MHALVPARERWSAHRGLVRIRALLASFSLLALGGCLGTSSHGLAEFRVEGDGIAQPLAAAAADPERGREVVMGREGNCLLCHALPETGARFMGDLGPSLSGVGARLTASQLRLRLVDAIRLNPQTIMPSYYRVDGLARVASPFRGKPILSARQIEDVIAYLEQLR